MRPALKEMIKLGEESPLYELLNIEIEEVNENYARLSMEVNERHTQFLKMVHGGVVASLADSAAAWAIYGSSNFKGIPVTVEMKINFLKPAKLGKLIAEARNIHEGTRIFVCDVDVKDSNGMLVAKSLVTYYIVNEKKPYKSG